MSEETSQSLPTTKKTRTPKTGQTRLVVSITTEHATELEKLAIADSTVFPRPANEMLSILIDKYWDTLSGGGK